TLPPFGVVLSVFIRKLLGNNDNRIILFYALPLMLFSFALLVFINIDISLYKYVIATLCYGIGAGLFQSSLIHMSMNQQKDKQSTLGGILRLFQNGGIIVGAAYSLSL